MRVPWIVVALIGCSSPDPPLPSSKPAVVHDAAPDAAPFVDPLVVHLEERAARYHEPTPASLVPYRDRDKWGFADRAGTVVIPARFDRVQPFRDGRAVVYVDKQCGIIDSAGYEVIAIEADRCFDMRDGHSAVAIGFSNGVDDRIIIDRAGRPITRERYSAFGYVGSDGLIAVQRGNKLGFLDHTGKLRIAMVADRLHNRPSDGRIAISDGGGKWGAIDYDGKLAVPFEHDVVQGFYRGLSLAKQRDKWGVIDRDGKTIVPFEYAFIHGNADGEYFVAQRVFDKPPTEIFDRSGTLVRSLPVNAEDNVREGLIVVEKSGRKSWIDITGKLALPFKYDSVNAFAHGLAWVHDGNHWGFIDRKGKVVVPFHYETLYDYATLEDDMILKVRDPALGAESGPGLTFYIDATGREYLSARTRAWYRALEKR